MVAKAQKHANKKQKAVEVSWRGYKMSVKPNLPTFTKYDLDNFLFNAVDFILDLENKEKKEEKKVDKQHENGHGGDQRDQDQDSLDLDLPDIPGIKHKKLSKSKSKQVRYYLLLKTITTCVNVLDVGVLSFKLS